MASYLVTGASRGLGLTMVARLASSSNFVVKIIFAAARSQTTDLKDLIESPLVEWCLSRWTPLIRPTLTTL